MTANRFLPLVGAMVVLASALPAAQQAVRQPGTKAGAATASSVDPTRLLSSPRSDLVSLIQGNALDATNGQLANALVRLRDARFGQILNKQVTDKLGLFEFKRVEPGTYIVEMVAADETILAASQLLNVNAGEAVSTVVKLPFQVSPFAGVLDHSNASLLGVSTQAATSTILVVAPVGDATCDLGQGSS
jgi:hypothetical protein